MRSSALSTRRRFMIVLCGGFLGAMARYLLSGAIQAELGKGWPYDILFINLTGALLLAFVTPLADATLFIGPTRRLFLTLGKCCFLRSIDGLLPSCTWSSAS